ncbi:Signal transducer regulating beta-lactamase production, contains metallopeptidase domain [Chitinophaga jiangningensis]|uniref:Signal transducer regulating beta-lactamase production, contains metallopeptidase domain n=1 Tax=Chitinophaga jiangningensis TaxID=1419482 RepID=A0A1M6YK44_9BACT|nr:M56 family metallopeptidase [Chitinophaga jiangningensis]SHL18493.1 Signal transducer regulating beta-lactamase production, contains metallopeptidase domain [Chitinophaga jiangningensis]
MTFLPLTADLVRALGWTILHSTWQSLCVFAALRIVLALWPMASARIKYNLSVLSLGGIFTWFVITLYQQISAFQEAREIVAAAVANLQLTAAVPEGLVVETMYKSQDGLTGFFPQMENWFPVLVTLYVIGFCIMTIKLFADLAQLQRIRTDKTSPMDASWEQHLARLSAQLDITRPVKLLVSGYIQVPVMLGFLKPIILLPVAMVNNLSTEQLEAILLHELAHIKRNDYLLNIFQSIVETILFFNPFVWQISRIIRQEREHCCDDLVVNSVHPLHYAKALVALEEYRLSSNSLAMAAANNKQHLFNRIKRIMEMKTKNLNYSQKFLAVMIIAAGLISIAWLNPAKVKASEKEAPATKEVLAHEAIAATNNTTTEAVVSINEQHAEDAVCTDTVPPPPAPPAVPGVPDAPPVPAPPAPPAPGEADFPAPPAPPAPPARVKGAYVYSSQGLSPAQQKKLEKQIREAEQTIQKAMAQLKEVDMKKIQAESKAALDKVDWKQMNADIVAAQNEAREALKGINFDEMMASVKNSVNVNVNVDSIRNFVYSQVGSNMKYNGQYHYYYNTSGDTTGLAAAEAGRLAAHRGRLAAEKSRMAAEKNRLNAEKQRAVTERNRELADRNRQLADENRARADRDRDVAHARSNRYHKIIDQMAADKLLDKNSNYEIEYSNNTLRVNGVTQPDNITRKYKSLIDEDNLKISGGKDHLNISSSNNNKQ